MVEYEHQTRYRILKRGDIGLPSEIIANSIYWQELGLFVFGTSSNLGVKFRAYHNFKRSPDTLNKSTPSGVFDYV